MGQIKCPYCNSVQVKAMANQPKKYPRPTNPALLADWQKGYDCKKCGNDFIVMPPKPKKPISFFSKLIKYSLIFIIALIVISIFIEANESSGDSPKEEAATKAVEPETIIEPEIKEDPLDQEFSKEAEEAAHAYIAPVEEPQKSIADSQDMSDTLSIKTTIREAE